MRTLRTYAVLAFGTGLVVACGGGGGGGSSPPPTPPTPTSVTISGVVADGLLQGATACYDLNDNGVCDGGEPVSGASDADGKFTLAVDEAVAGKHRIVVMVPATAIDKDTGSPVGDDLELQAPATGTGANQSVFVSPLTTHVQHHMDNSGDSLANAIEAIKKAAGLTIHPLEDFTKASSGAAGQQAALVARLAVQTFIQQKAALLSVVGTQDISGATITRADIVKASLKATINTLPAISAAVASPAIANAASKDALVAALKAAATDLVTNYTGLTATTAPSVIGMAKLPPDTSPPQNNVWGMSLTAFKFTNANDWYYSANFSSVEDLAPDANNNFRYYRVYSSSRPSASGSPIVQSTGWGSTDTNAQEDPHWNGAAWVSCPLGTRSLSSLRDAQGRSTYNFCDNSSSGTSQRMLVDISGKSMSDVLVNSIRTFPGGRDGVAYTNWGPTDLSLLGTATFPAGSNLGYFNQVTLQSNPSYSAKEVDNIGAWPLAVAQGGDFRTDPSIACAGNLTGLYQDISTLEELIERNPGKPCVFAQSTADPLNPSLDPNEWWGNTTFHVGDLPGAATPPAGTGNYYKTTLNLRVSFNPATNIATFYSCYRRTFNNAPHACTTLNTSAYSIQALGDGRVLSFASQPLLAQQLGYNRVYVQRGGKVHYGSTNLLNIARADVRLDRTATEALFAQLGMPAPKAIAPASSWTGDKALWMNTAKGVWVPSSSSGPANRLVMRIAEGGQTVLGTSSPTLPEVQGVEYGMIEIDPATGAISSLVNVDTNGNATGINPSPAIKVTSVTATSLNYTTAAGTAETMVRLPSDITSMVGMWAAIWGNLPLSHLKTQHYVFFDDGTFMTIDPLGVPSSVRIACAAANQGPAGVELANYTYDTVTGAMRIFNKQVDTNGCAGMFDSSAIAVAAGTANTERNLIVKLSADGMSATVSDPNTPNLVMMTFLRVVSQ